jgi:DNA-binding ferritin-like protein
MDNLDFAGSYAMKLKRKPSMSVESYSTNPVDDETAELAEELLMAGTAFHKLHLKIKDLGSYAAHKALNELYTALPDHVDALVESYQGASERIIKCGHDSSLKSLNTVEEAVSYIRELCGEICELQSMMPYSEIVNDLDTVKSTLNSAKYKLLFLK